LQQQTEKEPTIPDIEPEIECPRCYDIMALSSDFDRLYYFCEECNLSLFYFISWYIISSYHINQNMGCKIDSEQEAGNGCKVNSFTNQCFVNRDNNNNAYNIVPYITVLLHILPCQSMDSNQLQGVGRLDKAKQK
jgi:hypothetical protein